MYVPERGLCWVTSRMMEDMEATICYGGQIMPGSHIADLVKDPQYKYKHFKPIGHELFYKALGDMHIPQY